MKLEGKVAIVTGGAQGIGGGCASRLAADGAMVVVADINEEKMEAKVAEIESAGGQAKGIHCDVSDQAQVEALMSQTVAAYGRIDILVNNAALVHHAASNVHFLELDADSWQRALDINLTGAFFCAQQAAKVMVAQNQAGTGNGGSIINMTDIHAAQALKDHSAYSSAKAGLDMLTRSLARELAPDVRVNGIALGAVLWPTHGNEDRKQEVLAKTALQRTARLSEVCAAVRFLLNDADYITGQILTLDGGRSRYC